MKDNASEKLITEVVNNDSTTLETLPTNKLEKEVERAGSH